MVCDCLHALVHVRMCSYAVILCVLVFVCVCRCVNVIIIV